MQDTLRFWLPALVGMLCLGLGGGLIGVYGFFVAPLSTEFDVGSAAINSGLIVLLLVPGLVAPFVGKLADRLPIRRLVLTGVSLAMSSLVAVSLAPTLWLATICFIFFALGLTFYGPVVINGLLVKLYVGREARATAIAAIGISLASATLPPLMGILLSYMDWRSALAFLAVGVWVLLVVVSMSGLPSEVVDADKSPDAQSGEFERGRAFWLIGLCVASGLSVSIVLAVVYPPFFVSQGYSLKDAGWFLAFAGMAGLTGKACISWLGDRGKQHIKWVVAGLLLIQMAGVVLLSSAEGMSQVISALAFLGFGAGAFIPMHPYLNSRYFDVSVIGAVMGAQMPLFLPFVLVGAPLAGYAYDQTGSYELVFQGLMALLVASMLLALQLPRPRA